MNRKAYLDIVLRDMKSGLAIKSERYEYGDALDAMLDMQKLKLMVEGEGAEEEE